MISNSSIQEIIDFRSNRTLFLSTENSLGVDTAIITIKKTKHPVQQINVLILKDNEKMNSIDKKNFRTIEFDQHQLSKKKWSFETNSIITRLENNSDYYLGDDKKHREFSGICEIGKGCSTGNNRIFKLTKVSERVFEGNNNIKVELEQHELSALRLLIKNSDVSRYSWRNRGSYWIFLKDKSIDDYPNIGNYLANFTGKLERTQTKYGLSKFYDYAAYRSLGLIDHRPKILCPYQATENRFAFFSEKHLSTINETDVITLVIKEKFGKEIGWMYLLGVLNSELINYFSMINNKKIYNLYDFRSNQISNFPIMKCKKQLGFNALIPHLIKILNQDQRLNSKYVSSLLSTVDALVYELYFDDLLSSELNDRIDQTLSSYGSKKLDSIGVDSMNNLFQDLLRDDSIIRDLEEITSLKQIEDIRKFIRM